MKPLFELIDLKKAYGPLLALNIENLSLEGGKVYAVVGPNGAGKSTLLSIMALLERPTSGKMLFQGQDVYSSGADLTSLRRQMAFVMQEPYLFKTTVFKNVAYGLEQRGCKRSLLRKKVMEGLEAVGLEGFENRKSWQLSTGEAQRVAVARALCLEPEVLFLDEPMSSVDSLNAKALEKILLMNRERGKPTIIFATHDIALAYSLAHEVLPLMAGRLSPYHPENLFFGHIETLNGQQWLRLHDDLKVAVVTDKRGRAYMSLDPRDIILSEGSLCSSARNCFKGKVEKIAQEGSLVRVGLKVGSQEFTSLITRASFQELGLNLGKEAYLTFKSTAVKVMGA